MSFRVLLRSRLSDWIAGTLLAVSTASAASHRWVVSANENKLDLVTGSQRILPNAAPDSLTLLDFSSFPPSVRHLTNVPNTVLGPPSNVAISPDNRYILIADSIALDASRPSGWRPQQRIHILDTAVEPPALTSTTDTGLQPSGMCFNPQGNHLLVANRAAGSVSIFLFQAGKLNPLQSLTLADPAVEVSDVAVSPDDQFVIASLTKTNQLAVLRKQGDRLSDTGRRVSTYGKPYRVQFTPDGRHVLTAGAGYGNGLDTDALSIIENNNGVFTTVDFLPLAAGPESFDLSPDGQWGAAVFMNGSNAGPNSPLVTDHGLLVLFRRRGDRWTREQILPTGAIPEGVVFAPDGRHVVVQCHPDRELRIYRLRGGHLNEQPARIKVPGMPSGIAASRAR